MKAVTAESFNRAWEALCQEEPEARDYTFVVMQLLGVHGLEIAASLECGYSLRSAMGMLYRKARVEVEEGRASI